MTIEDITAEADVSLRTFSNYFSSKYEAICAVGTDRAQAPRSSGLEQRPVRVRPRVGRSSSTAGL